MKSKLLTSAVVLGLALPLATPLVANAADTVADSADKSASVEVTGGKLTIDKDDKGMLEAPSFQFGTTKVNDSAQTLTPTGEKNTKDTEDTYEGTTLNVDDETGTGAGWTVKAQLGAFSDGAGHNLDGADLNMIGSDNNNADAAPATAPKVIAGGADTPIFTAAAGKGMGKASTDLKGTTLDLPSAKYAGTYTATLTYTLTAGPNA